MPTFGRTTIRRFGANVSGFKKLAARDYEDLLQCALPVFEGLLPPRFNKIVLDMVFILATWHALAKLRLHSESTLHVFEQTTSALGKILRKFASVVCAEYDTKELPKETIARFRRAKPKGQPTSQGTAVSATKTTGQAKRKTFNMTTYKLHRLGDHPRTIRLIGTVENATTQTVRGQQHCVSETYSQ